MTLRPKDRTRIRGCETPVECPLTGAGVRIGEMAAGKWLGIDWTSTNVLCDAGLKLTICDSGDELQLVFEKANDLQIQPEAGTACVS